MPRNTTGGSGHKSQANKDDAASRKNTTMIENYISDIATEGKCDGVHVGRIIAKLGDGRFNVFYLDQYDTPVIRPIVVRGTFTGRGKRSCYLDVGSVVLVSETGLAGGMSHTILAQFNDTQLSKLSRIRKLDERLTAKNVTDEKELGSKLDAAGGFYFDAGDAGEEDKKGELGDAEIDAI